MVKSEQGQGRVNGLQEQEPTTDELATSLTLLRTIRSRKVMEYLAIDHGDMMARMLFEQVQRELQAVDAMIIVLKDMMDEA